MKVLIYDDQMESVEIGGNEVDEREGIFSPHQTLDVRFRQNTGGFQANLLWFKGVRGGVVEMWHWERGRSLCSSSVFICRSFNSQEILIVDSHFAPGNLLQALESMTQQCR